MKVGGHAALGEFILNIDQWFDCVNAGFQSKNYKDNRKPYTSIEDPRLKWLQDDFLTYLQIWEKRVAERPLQGEINRDKMLLSTATRYGLQTATKSVVAIIKHCLNAGADFVLPRRFNQDSLESYFGYQRLKSARNENPTVSMFSANARNIEIVKSKEVVHTV